jgi:hypothetical protein
MLLRLAGRRQVDYINWDEISFRPTNGSDFALGLTLRMNDPLGWTKAQTSHLFDTDDTLEAVLDGLAAIDRRKHVQPNQSAGGTYHEVSTTP